MHLRRKLQVLVALLGLGLVWWAVRGQEGSGSPAAVGIVPQDGAVTPGRTADGPPGPSASLLGTPPGGSEALAGDAAAPASGLRVLVSSTGKPLGGAEVRIFRRAEHPAGWQAAGAGTTDAVGAVTSAAPRGEYLVTAVAPGLARGQVLTQRPAGEPLTVVRLELTPGAALRGRTVERHGVEPVPLATVKLTPAASLPRARALPLPEAAAVVSTSDERGVFLLEHLAPGRWILEARAVGHAPAQLRDVVLPRTEELRVMLVATASIEGRVTQGGAPVAGATVRITGASGTVTVMSGPRGGFAAEVDPGAHHLFAETGGAAGGAERSVLVAAGQTVRGVELALGSPASIAGTVADGRGPVAGALVTAAPWREAGTLATTTAGPDGSYLLTPLGAGTYAVTASQGGRVTAGTAGIVLPSAARFHLDLVLPAPTAVVGTVSDDTGPVAGALVTAMGGWTRGGAAGQAAPGPGASSSARSGPDGGYRLDGVAPGRLRLLARRDEQSPVSLASVEVEEGETARADLVLVTGGLVGGTVRETDGTPVPGALVSAIDPGAGGPPGLGLRPVAADADGTYLLALAAGPHSLTAFRPEVTGQRLRQPQVLGQVVVAVGHRSDLDLVLPPRPPGTLAGRVLEPGGAGSAGATVWTGNFGSGLFLATADGEGAFTLPVPGTSPVTLQARNGGRTGTLSATPPQQGLVIPLGAAAAIQGVLQGDPAPESFELTAAVRGVPLGGAPTQRQFLGSAFQLDDQPPGQLALHVKTLDGRVGDATVTTVAGELANATVPLSPPALVTGRVVDAATGLPVVRGRVLLDGQRPGRGLGPDGSFSRVMTEGPHALTLVALGYQPLTVDVTARAAVPTALGDLPLRASSAQPTGGAGGPSGAR